MGILIQVEGIGKHVITSDRYCELWVFSSRWKGLGNMSTPMTGTVNMMGILIQVEGIGKHVNTSDRYCEFEGAQV
jgi:hypothetical protein